MAEKKKPSKAQKVVRASAFPSGEKTEYASDIENLITVRAYRALIKKLKGKKEVDATSPENKAYLDSMTQKVYTSDKDKT